MPASWDQVRRAVAGAHVLLASYEDLRDLWDDLDGQAPDLSSVGHRSEEGYLALFNRLRSICDIDPETGESAKLDRAVELVESAMADGCKTVVFSYMHEHCRGPAAALARPQGDDLRSAHRGTPAPS